MNALRFSIITIILFSFSTVCFSQRQMQDVVYLKNGSVIRGMIVEQIPNKTIKIETKDGNLFVYSFDEIQKITKESPRSSNKASTNAILFGVKGLAATDISSGAYGFGGGASIIYGPASSVIKYEFGLEAYYSKHIINLPELGEVSDATKLLLLTARTNILFNYRPGNTAIFYFAGIGVVGGKMDWKRIDGFNGTGNRIEEDIYSPIGNVFSFGLGLTTPFGLEPRLEVPLVFFYNAGNTSAFLPTVSIGLGYRF